MSSLPPPRVKVYSMLTLDARTILRYFPAAEVAPPVRRDDITRDIDEKVNAIAIIDGRFHQYLSVSCGELMDALRAGIAVFGASSMGALRAAELCSHGMIGHGKIFEHVKEQDSFRDDLVGQLFVEDAEGVCSLSIPFVDFYFNVLTLLERGEIKRQTFDILCSVCRELHYTERNYPALRAAVGRRGSADGELLGAAEIACVKMGSQKRTDAVGLLKLMKTHFSRVGSLNERLNSTASFFWSQHK